MIHGTILNRINFANVHGYCPAEFLQVSIQIFADETEETFFTIPIGSFII